MTLTRTLRGQTQYGTDSPHSWFRDLCAVAEADYRAELLVSQGVYGSIARRAGGGLPHAIHGDVEEARARLATVLKRDVTTGDPGAGPFLPGGAVPAFIADAFAPAARAEGTLAAALPSRPLPEGGLKIEVPRFQTGTVVAVQAAENDAVPEPPANEPDTEAATSNVAYIAGAVDVAVQALDRSGGASLDLALAADLGRALAAKVDEQLIAGSNASGQTKGIANVAGIKTVTYTDGTPTAQELVAQAWKAYNEIATNGYGTADPEAYLTVVHPRRLAFAMNNAQNGQSIAPRFPGRLVPCGGLRTTLGGGTEDEVYVLVRSESFVASDPVRINVMVEPLAGTLQVKVRAVQPAAAMFARQPASICRVSGTGLIAPTL